MWQSETQVTSQTSLRAWVNAYWKSNFEYEFEVWAQERIQRGVSAKAMSREITAMVVGDQASVTDNTLRSWFPDLRGDDHGPGAVAS